MINDLTRTAKNLTRWLGLPFALLVTAVLKILLPGRKVRIVVMDPRYFGHQCLEPEVFWNDWQSAKESGSRDVWLCCLGKKSAAANSYLWEHTREKFPTVPSWIVTRLAPWLGRLKFSNVVLMEASIYRLNFLTERASTLPPSPTFTARRTEILSNLSSPERPYVVFTIREPDVSYDPVDPRNRDINDFVPSMQALTRHGFNVIRLTSKTKYPLKSTGRHILDWQVLVDGRAADELALISGAEFVVSSTTGGDCLALAYRRPVLYIDSARLYLVFLGTELTTFQIPHLLDSRSGQKLGLPEILARNLGWTGEVQSFTDAGVTIANSGMSEIEKAVSEYAELLSHEQGDELRAGQGNWRQQFLARYHPDVMARHGEIRAQMLPSSVAEFGR